MKQTNFDGAKSARTRGGGQLAIRGQYFGGASSVHFGTYYEEELVRIRVTTKGTYCEEARSRGVQRRSRRSAVSGDRKCGSDGMVSFPGRNPCGHYYQTLTMTPT